MNLIETSEIMFIESSWQESLISLLIAINGAFGAADRAVLLRPLTNPDVIVIAQELEQRSYRPEQWFGIVDTAPQIGPAVASTAPAPHADQQYAVVRFAAEPSETTMVSSRSGGLLFEDPFYAVLAAFNFGKGSLAMEVKTSSREQAWARRQEIVNAIRTGSYDAKRYFAERGPLLNTRISNNWSTGGIQSKDLELLIFNGRAAVSFDATASMLYGLYFYFEP